MTLHRNLSEKRQNYNKFELLESAVDKNPFLQFNRWYNEAEAQLDEEVNAMVLSTADLNGMVSSRVVLLKAFGEEGFSFFTHYLSRKGDQIAKNPNGALLFFWPAMQRQVRIEGAVVKATDRSSDAYFKTRPRESQMSAIVSPQSKIIPDREFLEQRIEALKGETSFQRPENWGGYLLVPHRIEFWQGRPNRLHDRILYTLRHGEWAIHRMAP